MSMMNLLDKEIHEHHKYIMILNCRPLLHVALTKNPGGCLDDPRFVKQTSVGSSGVSSPFLLHPKHIIPQ